MGVELGRRRLLLPPPPPRRLGEKGGGRSERGGGWVCFATSLPVGEHGGGCGRGRPDDAVVGDLRTRDSPRAKSTYASTPSSALPSISLPRGRVWRSGPESGGHAAAPFPCNPSSPALSDTLRATRLRGGDTDHPRGAAAGRASPPPPAGQPAVTRRGAEGGRRRGTEQAPEWVGSRGAGRGREGGSKKTN